MVSKTGPELCNILISVLEQSKPEIEAEAATIFNMHSMKLWQFHEYVSVKIIYFQSPVLVTVAGSHSGFYVLCMKMINANYKCEKIVMPSSAYTAVTFQLG